MDFKYEPSVSNKNKYDDNNNDGNNDNSNDNDKWQLRQ